VSINSLARVCAVADSTVTATSSETLSWESSESILPCLVRHSQQIPSSTLVLTWNLDSERRQVCDWLERINPSTFHNAAIDKHEPLTSAWFLRSSEWASWLEPSTQDRFLWVYGIPGAGKTVLASVAIEELKKLTRKRPGDVCAYYYCHYSHNQDESVPFLGWLVSQVCRQARHVPDKLRDIQDSACNPTALELLHALEEVLERVNRVYVVVDAVDESTPREGLVRLIGTLALDDRFCKVHIAATSRQHLEIERVFSGISCGISMSNDQVDADIRQFTRAKLAASYRLKRWQHRHGDIEDVLVAGARGMFRWVDCQIRAIERVRDEVQLHAALQDLPSDLNETYIRIFDAIPEADRPFVRLVLVWICGHTRAPWVARMALDLNLLLSAVAFELYGPSSECPFDSEYLQDQLGCLITLDTEDEAEDEPYPIVALAHYTVLEFLTSPHILQTSVAFFSLPIAAIESEFAVSVLRQAVTADPTGTSASWVHDREAYCLTLGCALGSFMLDGNETHNLFMQYLTPVNPHFARFGAIQERIRLDENCSRGFYLGYLPGAVYSPSAPGGHDVAAELFLCVLLLPERFHNSLPFVEKLAGGRSLQDLLEVVIAGFFVTEDDFVLSRRPFHGTVRDIAGDEPYGRQRITEVGLELMRQTKPPEFSWIREDPRWI